MGYYLGRSRDNGRGSLTSGAPRLYSPILRASESMNLSSSTSSAPATLIAREMKPAYPPNSFTNNDEPLLEMPHDSTQSDALPRLALQFYVSYKGLENLNGFFNKRVGISPGKSITVMKADSLTEHPPDDSRNSSTSSGDVVDGRHTLSDSKVVPHESLSRSPSQSNSAMLVCPSPEGCLCSSDPYVEAKESFAGTELSECTDSNKKSCESEVANPCVLSQSNSVLLFCPSPEGCLCSSAPNVEAKESFAGTELSECSNSNKKSCESEVANPCVLSQSNSVLLFCASPEGCLCSSAPYVEAKESFAGTELSKCSDSNKKSSESEVANPCVPSQSNSALLFCPSPEGRSSSSAPYVEAKESTAGTELSDCTDRNKKFIESEVANPCIITDSRNTSIVNGVSDESCSSNFSSIMNKPHKARDGRWEAIQAAESRHGLLGLEHFRLLKKLGCGDIGSVYLSELKDDGSYFAMKVMDKPALANRKKLARAQMEKGVLQSLDHPFLPTLYVHFETEKFSCLVLEFCPGGDLHTLRQRQPRKYFKERAARFYAAEVLLALEYLHMLGIVYRDLKPENVLVQEDGHIMLVDFDLSLRCSVSPALVNSINSVSESGSSTSCVQPSCFAPRLFSREPRKEKKFEQKKASSHQENVLPELVAEPTDARSTSFVGTHEYLAPEIIKCEGHGSAVDWWTFGIFLYELLFGRTPFKGAGNRSTSLNIIGQHLKFPESPSVSFAARDLIRSLLVKDPKHRLAYRRGANEVKQHPFFRSINWALIRCADPPLVPKQATEPAGNCSDFDVF